MDSTLPVMNITHPWIFGSYAVYAIDLHVARRVYEYARAQPDSGPFGTVELESGEVIDWINMNYGVVCEGAKWLNPASPSKDVQ